MKFRFLGKTFIHRKQTKTTGAIIESETDLVKAFGDKTFELVSQPQAQHAKTPPVVVKTPPLPPPNTEKDEITDPIPQTPPIPSPKEETSVEVDSTVEVDSEEDEVDICDIESKLGKNVTGKFQCAMDATLCVFQSGIRYYVTKPENPEKALNKKFLNKTAVDDFVDLLGKE